MKDSNGMFYLRDYQMIALDEIYRFQKSERSKAKIYMATGTGKAIVITTSLKRLFDENVVKNVLLLSSHRQMCEQFREKFNEFQSSISIAVNTSEFKNHDILITTYQEMISHQKEIDFECFDLIICDEAQRMSMEHQFSNQIKVLGFFNGIESENGFFNDAECLFSYTLKTALEDGYIKIKKEENFINIFVEILKHQGYKNILIESKFNDKIYLDVIAEKNSVQYIFEIKTYRSADVSQTLIENAINQMKEYKNVLDNENKEMRYVVVMFCNVFYDLQKKTFEQNGIEIWDIGNLIYLCNGVQKISEALMVLTPYSLNDIAAKELMHVSNFNYVEKNSEYIKTSHMLDIYQTKLDKCKPGKKNGADKEYEKICTEILKYLFESDFLKMSEQHKTEDEAFRMDLLCSIKGTEEFWKFLINFYHTKFVVIEYKNYGQYVKQNLIYITEKYLFPAALRNVAIIISRNGFDENAHRAALGCLKESGKLMIDLCDEDLLKMIALKEKGEEPSDYLLEQVEQFLMSISK